MHPYKTIDEVPELERPYTVTLNGVPQYSLNRRLAKAQRITPEQLQNLLKLHEEKLKLFEHMKAIDPDKDRDLLKEGAADFEEIELEMQANWNFPQDRNFHEWYSVPHCTCPVLDNQDRRGTEFRVIVGTCPIHGK